MVTHMKTTIEIPDPVLEQARKLAKLQGTSVKKLVEQGLRRIISEQQQAEHFRLRPASFKGEGLQPELQGASWAHLRELAYDDRGA